MNNIKKFKLISIPNNKKWIFIEIAIQREKRLKKLKDDDEE